MVNTANYRVNGPSSRSAFPGATSSPWRKVGQRLLGEVLNAQ